MLLDKSTSGTLQDTCQASRRAQDYQGASICLSVTNFPYKFAAAVTVPLQTCRPDNRLIICDHSMTTEQHCFPTHHCFQDLRRYAIFWSLQSIETSRTLTDTC